MSLQHTLTVSLTSEKTTDTPRFALGLLLIAAAFGFAFLFLTPPYQVPDEYSHFARAIGITSGHCVAEPITRLPKDVEDMAFAFPWPLELQPATRRWITKSDYSRWLHRSLTKPALTSLRNTAANLYTCVPYLPSAGAIAVANTFKLPPLAVFYLGRLTNLVAFLLLIYASLRTLPDFHVQLLALVLMPMTLQQASSLSADAVTFGFSFFLLSYILKLIYDESFDMISERQILILAFAVIGNSLTKFNIWLVLLIVLIPAKRFRNSLTRWTFVVGFLALACAPALLWQIINAPNIRLFINERLSSGVDVAANTKFVRSHFNLVMAGIYNSFRVAGMSYLTMFVGKLGYLTISLPSWLAVSYILCLLFIAATQTARVHVLTSHRLWFAFVSVASLISIFVLLFNFEASVSYISYITHIPPSVVTLPGVQGRYFIPFALAALLIFSNCRLRMPTSAALLSLVLVSGAANLTALHLIWNEHYRNAELNKWWDMHVFQRADHKLFLVANGTTHYIPNASTLAFLNLHTPVSQGPPELDSIPAGTPIPNLPGRVVRAEHEPYVYFIDDGQRHHIPNQSILSAMVLADQIRIISDQELASIPLGAPVPPRTPSTAH